jgi:hypothetical protein
MRNPAHTGNDNLYPLSLFVRNRTQPIIDLQTQTAIKIISKANHLQIYGSALYKHLKASEIDITQNKLLQIPVQRRALQKITMNTNKRRWAANFPTRADSERAKETTQAFFLLLFSRCSGDINK